jgi:hypothetical protein
MDYKLPFFEAIDLTSCTAAILQACLALSVQLNYHVHN